MKNPVRLFKDWFSRHSMRTKLAVTFSCTVVLILLLLMILLNYFITRNYREQLLHTAEKSCDQAQSFLENYLETMIYVSDLIYYNNDLQQAMSSPTFNGHRNFGVQYREFLQLDKVFTSVEMVETIYRSRVFIPDDIFYSSNQRHFAGVSQLEGRVDYEEFLRKSQTEMVYFTEPEEVKIPGQIYTVNLVSLLRTIRNTDGTATPIGVEQVSILTSQLRSVLEKSDITTTGAVYLVNDAGAVISASGGGGGLLKTLSENGTLPQYDRKVRKWTAQTLAGESYLMNQQRLKLADWTLIALVPEKEINRQMTQIGSVILVLSLFAVAVVCTVSVVIARYYTHRLKLLTDMMHTVRGGDLNVGMEKPSNDEIGQLFRSFSHMTEELKELMQQQYKSGKAVKSAQLKALQAQINPHFLYNTLDLINWEAMDHGAPEIAEIAKSLARFYRISLNRGQQVVTIEQELRHVEAYVKIQNHHFDGAISLKTDVPEELLPLGCINIILQPLVENSIMHGIAEIPYIQECNVSISALREEGDVVFTVEDDGMGMTEDQLKALLCADSSDSHGYGVKNIDSRLKLSYGDAYGLTYRSVVGHGTAVTIRIPAMTPEEMERHVQ